MLNLDSASIRASGMEAKDSNLVKVAEDESTEVKEYRSPHLKQNISLNLNLQLQWFRALSKVSGNHTCPDIAECYIFVVDLFVSCVRQDPKKSYVLVILRKKMPELLITHNNAIIPNL
jgi:hypothetical protein